MTDPGYGYGPPPGPGYGNGPPPGPGYGNGPPPGPTKLSWRLAHSVWVLAPILSLGCLSAVGFLYVGVRARRPAWWIPGIVYSLIANVTFFTGAGAGEGSIRENVTYALLFTSWAVSIAHAFIINSAWLRWRAGYRPWYNQPPTPYYGPPVGAEPPVHTPPHPFGPAQAYAPPPDPFAPPQAYAPPPVQPDPYPPQHYPPPQDPFASTQFQAVTPPGGLLDVNTATVHQLAGLPGFTPERAAQAVAARSARGRFAGMHDFAAAVSLAPHEFAAVRDRIVC
ncbi:helix-hairpin-helix domain-containing protein [Actinoplanes bogorensis]|uniref:Helix-hairpin-helix domain-containing protein n=1 Tax=Paractinoplanes bogorensis TaxID=1610840 RepID=A0ABS5Z2B1_9ACTN|nr:helix-hairpin-helix domain-containing protein [Actinoplanes bogorensis]MBU2669836.1 helix-hairpin-helix domain-containing protein [Actinoplanes bogorensis]